MDFVWKCPDPQCPPTEKAPVPVTSLADDEPAVICRSECAKEYPKGAIRSV
jgi:hypothetical protein